MVSSSNRPTEDESTEDGFTQDDRYESGLSGRGMPAQMPDDEQIQAILERRRQAQAGLAPRPTLSPGFDAYTHHPTQRPDSRRDHIQSPTRAAIPPQVDKDVPTAAVSTTPTKPRWGFGWLMPWRRAKAPASPEPISVPNPIPSYRPIGEPVAGEWPYPANDSIGDGELMGTPETDPVRYPQQRQVWERWPYAAIAYSLLISGVLTTAWLLGILVAQVLPGNFERPPFQESILRKSSRLTSRLWHFSGLWDTPTTYSRIEAIPLPETGPVSAPIELPPIEKQPLVDELNAIETEVVTLERRLAALERRLGKSPYQGTGVDSRINTLRSAIDPPVRSAAAAATYEPIPSKPGDRLLDVAELNITLPADALFAPGDSQLKEAELLEEVLDHLVNYPGATISIRSHSDNQASATDSQAYTLAQAIALTRYLKRTLPAEHRWIAVGLGQAQPLTDNDDVINRQRNRRIEILVDTR